MYINSLLYINYIEFPSRIRDLALAVHALHAVHAVLCCMAFGGPSSDGGGCSHKGLPTWHLHMAQNTYFTMTNMYPIRKFDIIDPNKLPI